MNQDGTSGGVGERKCVKTRVFTPVTNQEKGWQIWLKREEIILVEVSILFLASYTPKL